MTQPFVLFAQMRLACRRDPHPRERCPKHVKCHQCSKTGHFATVCRSTTRTKSAMNAVQDLVQDCEFLSSVYFSSLFSAFCLFCFLCYCLIVFLLLVLACLVLSSLLYCSVYFLCSFWSVFWFAFILVLSLFSFKNNYHKKFALRGIKTFINYCQFERI